MKRLLRILLPTSLGAVSLFAMALPASADSVSLNVGSCVGGGYSYYYGSPAYQGTYEVYNNGSCLRVHARSWYSYGSWYNWGYEQSGSDIYYANYSATAARGKHQMVQGFSGTGVRNTVLVGGRQLRNLVVLALPILVWIAAACGDGDSDQKPSAELAVAMESASGFQRALLRDGRLTYEEYERAVLGTVSCLKSGGIEVTVEPRRTTGNKLEFAHRGGSTEDENARSGSLYDKCYREHQDLVDLVWTYQNAPTQATLAEARRALADCLRFAGLEVPEDPSPTDLRSVAQADTSDAFERCQAEITEKYDLSGGFVG